MHFDLVALAYNSQTVKLANAISMSLEFRVILNIALRCPVLSFLPCPFFNSAALPSPFKNDYVSISSNAYSDLYDINSM